MLTYDRSPRIATGPEAVKAANALRDLEARRDIWPFPWVYPPESSIRRNPMAAIVSPAIGAVNIAVILAFTVPQGFKFEMLGLTIGAFTTGGLPSGNPGDFTFSVDKNTPLGATTVVQGSPLADLQAVPFNLGNPYSGEAWFHFGRSETFAPNDTIRAKVVNVGGGVGSPVYCLAMFVGWLRKDSAI